MEPVAVGERGTGRRSLVIMAAAWEVGAAAVGLACATGVLTATGAFNGHHWTIIGCLLGIVLLMMASAMIGTSVMLRSVREMTRMLDRLGGGDLTAQVKVTTRDEIGAQGEATTGR